MEKNVPSQLHEMQQAEHRDQLSKSDSETIKKKNTREN